MVDGHHLESGQFYSSRRRGRLSLPVQNWWQSHDMVHMVNVVAVNWTNCILKQLDTVLPQFTKDISLEDKRDLRNSLVSNKAELLPLFLLCEDDGWT